MSIRAVKYVGYMRDRARFSCGRYGDSLYKVVVFVGGTMAVVRGWRDASPLAIIVMILPFSNSFSKIPYSILP